MDPYEDVDEEALQIQLLHKRINQLGLIDRSIILLWLEGLSYEEIGAIVGISIKNVSVKLVRIREILKERFDKHEIVTDKLMRNTIRRKISTYNWISLYIPVIIMVPAVIGMFGLAERLQLPVWPCIAAAVICAVSVLVEYFMRSKHKNAFCLDEDICKTVHSAKEYKLKETKLLAVEGICVLLFLGLSYYSWFSAATEYRCLTADPSRWLMFVLVLSAIIGIVAYASMKSLRIIDDIIKDLEE